MPGITHEDDQVKQPVKHRFGWKPDLPDIRDHLFSVEEATALPASVDLQGKCPAVYDQGQLGSCTANGIGAVFEFEVLRQGLTDFMPSRLFIYFNERMHEGTINQDAGAAIRDGIKSIVREGVAPEALWPYDIEKFAEKPPAEAYAAATSNQALAYKRINNRSLHAILASLAAGLPVVFGTTLYESFESAAVAQTGLVPMPVGDDKPIGGHCMVIVGYDSNKKLFTVRNSWGPGWGDNGHCYFPFEYLTNDNLACDFWQVSKVE